GDRLEGREEGGEVPELAVQEDPAEAEVGARDERSAGLHERAEELLHRLERTGLRREVVLGPLARDVRVVPVVLRDARVLALRPVALGLHLFLTEAGPGLERDELWREPHAPLREEPADVLEPVLIGGRPEVRERGDAAGHRMARVEPLVAESGVLGDARSVLEAVHAGLRGLARRRARELARGGDAQDASLVGYWVPDGAPYRVGC